VAAPARGREPPRDIPAGAYGLPPPGPETAKLLASALSQGALPALRHSLGIAGATSASLLAPAGSAAAFAREDEIITKLLEASGAKDPKYAKDAPAASSSPAAAAASSSPPPSPAPAAAAAASGVTAKRSIFLEAAPRDQPSFLRSLRLPLVALESMHNSGNFVYARPQARPRLGGPRNAYDLEVVEHRVVDPGDYFTVSKSGVTHVSSSVYSTQRFTLE
jgi:hypothetical protein